MNLLHDKAVNGMLLCRISLLTHLIIEPNITTQIIQIYQGYSSVWVRSMVQWIINPLSKPNLSDKSQNSIWTTMQ